MNVRRFLWAVLLVALGVMLVMAYLQRRVSQSPPATTRTAPAGPAATKPAASQPSATKPARAATSPTPTTQPATEPTVKAAPKTEWRNDSFGLHQRVLGSQKKASDYKLRVELTNAGAAVKTIKLADYFETVADKRRCRRDPSTYEQAVKEDPKLRGHYTLVKPVVPDATGTYPMATRRVTFPDEGVGLGLSGPRWLAGDVTTSNDGTQSVMFTSEILRDGKPFVRLEKTYSLEKNSYSVKIALRVVNLEQRNLKVALTQFGPTGMAREDPRGDRRGLAFGKYVKDELKVSKKGISKAKKMEPGLAGAQSLGRSDAPNPVLWIGQTNKFFAAAAYVVPQQSGTLKAPRAKAEFFKAVVAESPESRTYLAFMELGPFDVPAGRDVQVTLDVFAGPKKRALFDETPLYKALRYKDTLDFGSCFCTFAPLSLAMMWLLDLFGAVMFGNYGLAIILLVILVRIALHPLTRKGQASMARMQKLQPELQKIREKYKDDKTKVNEEMMKLYKSQGASPLLGCLPMFLQMPIWIALWTGLQAAVELRHAAFLPVWITDLAAPDALVDFGRIVTTLPMLGPIRSFNLLPLLLTVAMVLQQRLNPSTPTSNQQAKTQKQMMYFMSGFFLLIFYNAPSGLTMYIMASTFAGVAEQYAIRKHIREKDAAEAAAETRVAIPGKRFRGQKPKKPKGPFRFTK